MAASCKCGHDENNHIGMASACSICVCGRFELPQPAPPTSGEPPPLCACGHSQEAHEFVNGRCSRRAVCSCEAFEPPTPPAAPLVARLRELEKQVAILTLSVPLEEDLSACIDEMHKYLAMEDGFTLAGIARLLTDVQRRMAADWLEIGKLRRELKAALAASPAPEDEPHTCHERGNPPFAYPCIACKRAQPAPEGDQALIAEADRVIAESMEAGVPADNIGLVIRLRDRLARQAPREE